MRASTTKAAANTQNTPSMYSWRGAGGGTQGGQRVGRGREKTPDTRVVARGVPVPAPLRRVSTHPEREAVWTRVQVLRRACGAEEAL